MRFSTRSKLGIVLSLVTILTLASAFMVTAIASRGSSAKAASAAGVSYHTASGKLSSQSLHLGGQAPAQAASQTVYAAPEHSSGPSASANTAAPHASAVVAPTTSGALLHNFNGLSGLDTTTIAGVRVHPPDQGLCVGHDASIAGNPKVEFEAINLVVAEYNTSGVVQKSALMPSGKESLNNFFNEPGIPFNGGELTSDPRCIYDKPTDTFFFSILAFCAPIFGCPGTAVESHLDLIVYNATSGKATEYKVDASFPTHPGCPCLGDQPKIGVDNNAVYLSVDEFEDLAAGGTIEDGADVFIFSKPQLVAQGPAVNFLVFTNLAIGGIPVTSLQPAISTSSTNTEFLANAFPSLADGENNPIAHTLGFWKVTGDSNVTTGNFSAVIIAGKVITSETYAFPVLALSTGSGARRSSAFLNPDDDRLQQCQFVSGNTWCSLTTAININGDPATRDGVAWFKLSTSGGIAAQGYVAKAGSYLIYPAIVHSGASGSTGIVFTLTSGSVNPSAAFVFASSGTAFGGVRIAGAGAAPSTDGASRWGDYSAAALDPNGTDLWMATEYVPSGFTDPIINFGTRVFDVA